MPSLRHFWNPKRLAPSTENSLTLGQPSEPHTPANRISLSPTPTEHNHHLLPTSDVRFLLSYSPAESLPPFTLSSYKGILFYHWLLTSLTPASLPLVYKQNSIYIKLTPKFTSMIKAGGELCHIGAHRSFKYSLNVTKITLRNTQKQRNSNLLTISHMVL
ncbi:hypothetical protein NPIL_305421 [Nephila pilipes]|uniref:Uncharacterized protein n=1 Tax=Nephila pilipes TaxID=299642 RepID=A0A8X6NAS1_NEPPI|nr:hypothetical protein NPIL_305421 [Nephila pilipes]